MRPCALFRRLPAAAPARPRLLVARLHSRASAAADGAAPASAAPAQAARTSELPRVVLKGGKSKLFTEFQSPTVYGGAVDRVLGRPAPKTGDMVLVCDGAEQPIGWGLFNPDSMFRVRLMQTVDEVPANELQGPDFEALLRSRLEQAVQLRRTLGLPSPHTNVYRLCNSEGDRLSGLIVDVLGDQLVVASSAAWVERHRQVIMEALQGLTGSADIVWRPSVEMLKEEGWAVDQHGAGTGHSVASSQGGAPAGQAVEAVAGGEDADGGGGGVGGAGGGGDQAQVVVLENGVKYAAAPLGQKTGFYADQRDSRAALRALAAGRRVLDLCCYSGGFAINAALGGATEVTGVDSSAAALELSRRNAELNGVEGVCSFTKGDAADYMKQAVGEGRQWDVVVFDPPKLAPNRKALARATHRYRRLNAQAMRLVAPGGLLMTCSCSGAMSQSGEFVPMLQAAAREAGRRIVLLREAGAAMCHTLDPAYPEGKYLTNVLVRVL